MFGFPTAQTAPTPKDTVLADGPASLYRFRRPPGAPAEAGAPVLLVPSLINRWYILDLRRGASLVGALCSAGLDVWCLDWGVPRDEDRYLSWDRVLERLARAERRVRRATGARRTSVLGYCMGGTVAAVHAALHPDETAALVNLAGPFDFEQAGLLATLTQKRFLDTEAIASAGNLPAPQMQSGFNALRPTQTLAKWVGFADRMHDAAAREAFLALETWASDNIPCPAAAWSTWVKEFYQENRLVRGEHAVGGRRVRLDAIRCPVMTIVAERDAICPPASATALNDLCGAEVRRVLRVPGGHVGAVVGSRASSQLYPALAEFFRAAQA